MKTPILASAITLLSCALSSTAHAEVLAATHADFSTTAQGTNGFYYGYYDAPDSTTAVFTTGTSGAGLMQALTDANGPLWAANAGGSNTPSSHRFMQHPSSSGQGSRPPVRRYVVGAPGEPAYTGTVRIVGRFFDLNSGSTNVFVATDLDGDAAGTARVLSLPSTHLVGPTPVAFDFTTTVSPNTTIEFGVLSNGNWSSDATGLAAWIVTEDAAVPTNVVANNYSSPQFSTGSGSQETRGLIFALTTDGVIGGTDATSFDTSPGTGFPYQFAGLLYLENSGSGKATRFDAVSIDLTTSGDFSDTPRLYVLRHNSDPASSNPALDDRYARMPIVPVRTASNSAGQPAYTFDLTSLSPAERTGYGFAVVGAGMYQGTSISVSELSATAVRVADTDVITPQPFLVPGPNDHRYGLSVVRGDWEQSEASAVAAGGHLVTINDAVENAFLVPQFGVTERFYIGLKQDGPGATTEPGGGWRWRTGELLSAPGAYLNWYSTQPNGSEGPEEDFGFMNEWPTPGTWGDAVVGGYPPALRNTFRGIIELDTAGTGAKTFFVPEISAKSNIFDAGLAAPTQGGSLPPSIDLTGFTGQNVTFPQIVGVINTAADVHGPDGAHTAGRSCDLTSVGGISGYLNGNNTPALVGVFLGPTLPVSAPPRLDFSTGAVGEDFTTLAPALGQVFFIGDGFTSAGIAQKFTVPAGATRLYFGVPDGNSSNAIDNATLYHGTPNKYADNAGSISLRATMTPGPIPTIVDAFFPLRGGQLTFLGGTGASTVAVHSGALPTGMSISTSGLVTGVPTDGPYSFTLRVTDSLGEESDHVFSGNIGPVLSTFDSDADGWTAIGDPTAPPQFFATGGNPAGRIQVTDGGDGVYMVFNAPAKFLGNQSEKYGGTLHFDLMQSYSGAADQTNEPDVTLISGLLTLVFDTSPNPANNAWTSYSVPLTETAGWKVGSLTGPAPTQAQMQSVLGNLSVLRIRAEFQKGPDTDSLDNARLVAPNAVPEIAVEHPVGTALTDGSGSVLFGTYNLGTPTVKTFTISNSATATGNLNLTGTKPTVDGTHGGDFVAGDYGSTSLAPGASTTVTVTFTPTAGGTRTAVLHIGSDDADENPFDIALSGDGSVLPDIAVEHPVGTALTDGSGSVLFGTYNLGTPTVKTFTISNSATATGNLNLTGTKPTVDGTHGGEFVAGDYGSTSLAPGASTTVTVTFTPTAIGPRTAELHIGSDDADETSFDILMEGAGNVPIGVEAVSTFDTDTDGWTAVSDVVTNAVFSATGGNPGGHIYVTDAATGGVTRFSAPAKFLGNQSGKYGGTLSFDLSQTYTGAAAQFDDTDIILVGNGMTLVYDTSPNPAKDAWTSYSISLTETSGWKIDSLTGSAPSQIQMQGVLGNLTSLRIRCEFQSGADTGSLDNPRLTAALAPEIAVEQPVGTGLVDGVGAVNFGSSELLAPVTRTFTITNTGTAQLTLTPPVPSGDFIPGVIGDTTLDPTQSTTFTVTFTPSAPGVRTGVLQITSNDADENPFDIALTGTGSASAPEIAVEQPAGTDLTSGGTLIDFGSNIVGGGNIRTFTILNTGPGVLNGIAASIDGTDSADFVVSADPAATLDSGGSTTLTVRFRGSVAALRTAKLHIASNDADENPFDIDLTGTATTSTLNATFNSAGDVPFSVDGLNASGLTLNLSLGFVPETGTNLLVVNNTGSGPITGTFSGIPEGTKVTLTFGGQSYDFIATYLGGSGNDFVLAWPGGGLVSWGFNFYGGLGDGTTTTVSPYTKPNPTTVSGGGVLAGKTVVAVAAGQYFSLALTTDGKVYSWGRNHRGQLGNATTADSSVPVAVDMSGALAGKQVIAIAAGTEFGVALTSEGRVFAWGANELGQLGNGTFTPSSVPVPVTTSGVLTGKFVNAISAGNGHVLVLTDNGRVYGWGHNAHGQLGNGTVTTMYTNPVEMNLSTLLAAGRTVRAISAGYYHSLVIDSANRVLSCGDNSVGELGVSLATASSATLVPITLTGPLAGEQVASVSAGGVHSLGVTKTGKLFAWGDNLYGQLGIGVGPATSLPVTVVTAGALLNKTVVATSAGLYFSLVLTTDGQLYSWGKNNSGILGDGTLVDRNTPVAVDTTGALAGQTSTFIAAGYDHSVAIAVTHPVPEIAMEYPLGTDVSNNGSVSLGNQAMGLQGPAQTFTIFNPGNSPLNITHVGISGGNVSEYALNTTGMATSIPAGGSTTFSISFTPVNLGARTTTLTIVTDDADEASFVLNLRGDGVAPASGAVAFASATQDVPEGSVANIMLTRTGGIDGEATVRVSSTAGTAKAADFTPLVNQIVTFPNGFSTVSVPVNITADTLSEAHETFTLKLSSPTTATLGTLTTTTVRIIDSIDTTLPSVAFLLPLPHVRANIIASGTAKDDKGVSRVVYSWNNGPLLDVPDLRISTNGLSASWSVPLVCTLGTNTLRVRAIDTRGNSSNEVVQTYNSILRPITVNQTGPANSGTLSSLFPTTRDLLVGHIVTIVATPKPGFVFGGWTANNLAGTNITPAMQELPSLTFTHQEGLVLDANFIATPFTAAVLGTYNGLIIPSAELPAPGGSSAGDDTVGFITCTLGANGSLTGNLRINGMDKTFERFIAVCDIDGDVRFSTKRLDTIRFSPNIELALHFDLTDGTQLLTGTLTRKARSGAVIAVSKVRADRSPFSTTNKVSSSYAGTTSQTYTLRLKPRASQGPGFDLEHYPQGDGFGSLTVKADGSVSSILNLPDGTTATSSARISSTLQAPLFAQLYGARGSISAQVQFDDAQTNSDALSIPFPDRPDLDGLLWFRPMLDVQHYPYGWDEGIFTDLIACKYNKAIPLPGLGPVNSTSGNLDLTFSGGELVSSLIKFVNLTPTGTVSKAPPTDTSFTIKVTAASGSMSGTLTHSSSTPTAWQGVLLQKGTNRGGFGYFRTNTPAEIDYTGQTGSVILQPK